MSIGQITTAKPTPTWDGPLDGNNPLNWSNSWKWINVLLVSVQGTLSPIFSTVLALGSEDVALAFGLHDPYTPALPIALYVLGLGIGPLFLAPLSELHGRRIVYLSCFTIFTVLNVGCALAPNIAALSTLRLLSGMAGSAGPSLGGSSISDMFSREHRVLAYLGAGTGSILGTIICAKFLNRSYRYAAARHEERTGTAASMPEFRLPFLQVGMMIVPIGLVIFGWSAEKETHWVVPLLGACIFGLGMLMGYVCIQKYLVDAFEEYAASALAAAIVTRCVISCVFTVVGFQLYRRLGYAWGTMLLAFICIAMTPIPFVLQHYGPQLRSKKFDF
ncbi:hypothetical protein SS1G_00245 [Sclerotinia sclerotiorum 1980 UF-70]|uniref:Major facilitator superfamily (MFS) profile domain-containing protein n=1 Tax=Sclerotinia sclerotiorum (strain ATCC 18683 / 1980 / Ss-1) TaxID=665079 RepID=A7E4M3_SCLS1|nr:hypothetical protein SS1G_00245 [Sclerotinia sclerotiorum 1980 UF-70]EDN90845.1 hypothetical protein SS1G_00245 [Sclerotinia sclerotiorum 1980 UF-70]